MASLLTNLTTRNYRCLADLSLELRPINVFFGANGSGKSTILDALCFVGEAARHGLEYASAKRGHGSGVRWDGASETAPLVFTLATQQLEYTLSLGFTADRIDPVAGETLRNIVSDRVLLTRETGSDRVVLADQTTFQIAPPDRLSLTYSPASFVKPPEVMKLETIARSIHRCDSRSFDLHGLRISGSPATPSVRLDENARNAWSVLRNLQACRSKDKRYDTIMNYMKGALPAFDGLFFEEPTSETVHARILFLEGKSRPAAAVSDGHLQLLLLLTSLFAAERGHPAVLLFDEPEVSLHPWALARFVRAVEEATRWNRQVIVATQSPALLNQFETPTHLAVSLNAGRTVVDHLVEREDLKDLLEQYSTGSLYMAELVGAQSSPTRSQAGN